MEPSKRTMTKFLQNMIMSQHTPANRVKTCTRLYIQHFTIYIQMATEHSPTKKADRNADDYMSVQNSIT